mmetsp:Transcript_6749/g.21038  ORF Transcript_6749/g.21038 Transcript_6749/m.21038 type:complete len:441 (+) Transcript_6749:1452-2774(+)
MSLSTFLWCATPVSQGRARPRSVRRDVCAKTAASGLVAAAAATISRSALKPRDMCCSAWPLASAACSAKSHLLRSSSAAPRKAAAPCPRHCSTSSASARSASLAPCNAEPWLLLEASSTKPRSPRSSSLAHASASPLTSTASSMKSRSPRSSIDASESRLGLHRTTWRKSLASERSSSATHHIACPQLTLTAANMSSRSPRSSAGASSSLAQFVRTAARQFIWLQLVVELSSCTEGSEPSAARIPLFSAAEAKPWRMAATPGRLCASALGMPNFCRSSTSFSFSSSSSSSVQSSLTPTNLRRAADSLSLTNDAALAAVRSRRLAMSRSFAATMSSNSMSLSTLMNAASHLRAPHSTRSSDGIGISIAPGGTSLWYLKYSTTLLRVLVLSGNLTSSETPCLRMSAMIVLDMLAASTSTSKASPSLEISVTISSSSSSGHPS